MEVLSKLLKNNLIFNKLDNLVKSSLLVNYFDCSITLEDNDVTRWLNSTDEFQLDIEPSLRKKTALFLCGASIFYPAFLINVLKLNESFFSIAQARPTSTRRAPINF